MYIKQHNLTK